MRHIELVKHQCMTDKNALNRLNRRQKIQQYNVTIQQLTAPPLPQQYSHVVWDDEEGRMLKFRDLLNHKNP